MTTLRQQKDWWNIAKKISNFKNKKLIIPPFKVNDELIYNNKIKCELFNNFVVAQTELDDANDVLLYMLSESEYVLNNINITEQTLLICLIFMMYLKLLDPTVLAPIFLRKEHQF